MELVIKAKNLHVDERTQGYISEKMRKLERHFPGIGEVKVEVAQEMTRATDNQYVVQVTIKTHGTLLRAEERGPSITVGVDTVLDVLDRQIERFKARLYRSNKKNETPRKPLGALAGEQQDTGEQPRKIVKVKRFPVKPMPPEEAAEQMELLSHDFFIFFNSDKNQFSVIYRRSDGDYGLIEPELA
ncbi:MAG: ribosome-associated translation inhibitor RaiA [Dehalococcoidia bacterium]|nr:ribosome-associated translation inhibitor RaiA [Dehalococcoidia bacterium]